MVKWGTWLEVMVLVFPVEPPRAKPGAQAPNTGWSAHVRASPEARVRGGGEGIIPLHAKGKD